ncbi:transducin (beta)-like 1 [Nematocida homosporus]|uniref:transducin (beta)-like 1 n=1 Tax=Nematocida homosporus TaxID=1912981 RepID=UPI00221E612D|nr:transducin (beta)-like 1 [Nematocida homosporus]KAI5184768.1 transducin (beta)-like 1 [Nematocida homosporus]
MITLTSTELNYLIYRYLLEEGYEHTAYTFGRESMIEDIPDIPPIPHDAIKQYITKGVEMEYIEKHTDNQNRIRKCVAHYSIFTPHKCVEQVIEIEPTFLQSQKGDISLCAWAANGELITGSQNCTLRHWSMTQVLREWEIGQNEGSSHGITGLAIESNSVFGRLPVDTTIVGAAYTGAILVAKGDREWRSATAHKGPVVAISLKDEELLTGGWDGTCKRWDIDEDTLVERQKWLLHKGPIMDILSLDSGFVTCGVDKTICCVDRTNTVTRLNGHTEEVNAIRWAGNTIVSCSDDKTLKLWRYGVSTPLGTLSGHSKEVYTIDCFDTTVASGSFDSTARLWDLERQEPLAILDKHTKPIYSVAFSPEGDLLATGGLDAVLRLWDVRSNEIAKEFHVDAGIYQVSFSTKTGQLAICSSDPRPIILDIRK